MEITMVLAALKVVGYGLGAIGPGIGIGIACYGCCVGTARQPELQGRLFTNFILGAALAEALADAMLRRLKCSNEFRERAVRLVEWHDREIPRTDKGVRRALRALGEEDLRLLLALKRADNLAQAPAYRDRQRELDKAEEMLERLLAEGACFSLRQLAVDGRDMMRLGLTGPAIGQTLNALLDAVVNGETPNEREALLTAAQGMREEQPEAAKEIPKDLRVF